MLIPIDRPIIDANNIAAAATQTVSDNFVATHNHRPVLILTCDSADRTSNGSTPIQAGAKAGQLLTIILDDDANRVTIQHSGNCKLNGNWVVADSAGQGAWLIVLWDGTYWREIGRGNGELTISGLCAYAEGGHNTASGQHAHAEGAGTTASGDYSHAEGYDTTASGDYSHAEGRSSQANANYSSAKGWACTANGQGSSAEGITSQTMADAQWSHAMGNSGRAEDKFQFAHGGGKFSSAGDAQYSRFVLRESITHSDANWHTIGINDTGIGPIIPADSAWTFQAQVVGQTQDGAKVFSYLVSGCIKRVGSTTTLLASNVTTIHEDDSDFDCQAAADQANDALSIQVKDATSGSDSVRWVATVELTQITYT